MILRSVLLVLICISLLGRVLADGRDELAHQHDALAESLEQPLRGELLSNGYTPRNAAVAASILLDKYAQCLTNMISTDTEPEVTTVPLGDAVFTVYKSDCLTEFLNSVADLS